MESRIVRMIQQSSKNVFEILSFYNSVEDTD